MSGVIWYCDRLGPWPQVAEKLDSKFGLEPKYWVANPTRLKQIKKRFPEIITHSKYKAARGVRAPNFSDSYARETNDLLDGDLLCDQSFHTLIMMKMMDRMDPGNDFSYDERFRHYTRLLAYWDNVTNHFDIGYVIFYQVPHMISDYILYIVCKYKNITPIIFKKTPLPGISYTKTDVYEPSQRVAAAIEKDLDEIRIPEAILKKINHFKENNSQTISNKSGFINRNKRRLLSPHKYPDYMKHLMNKMSFDEIEWWLKKPGQNPEDGTYKNVPYQLRRLVKARFKKYLLKRQYSTLSEAPNMNENFIYLPLHYQPEMTTSPQAGIFVHQYLVADHILKSLPDKYELYIKEHPVQFSKSRRGELGRRKYHYQDLSNIDSVKLINMDVSSLDLINNADLVATATGTAGWEALTRGTPALVFGDAWYRYAEGVFEAKNYNDAGTAVMKAIDGYRIKENYIQEFVKSMIYSGLNFQQGDRGWHGIDSSVSNINQIIDHIEYYI